MARFLLRRPASIDAFHLIRGCWMRFADPVALAIRVALKALTAVIVIHHEPILCKRGTRREHDNGRRELRDVTQHDVPPIQGRSITARRSRYNHPSVGGATPGAVMSSLTNIDMFEQAPEPAWRPKRSATQSSRLFRPMRGDVRGDGGAEHISEGDAGRGVRGFRSARKLRLSPFR